MNLGEFRKYSANLPDDVEVMVLLGRPKNKDITNIKKKYFIQWLKKLKEYEGFGDLFEIKEIDGN